MRFELITTAALILPYALSQAPEHLNIVLHKPAYQSSTDIHIETPSHASNANDGNFMTNWDTDETCSHTQNDPQAWWAVDLLRNYTLAYVTLTNRNAHGHRLANIHVGVTNVVPRDQQRMSPSQFNLKECDFYPGQVPDDATVRINCPPRITGRYLVVQLQDSNFLTLCEVTAAAVSSGNWSLVVRGKDQSLPDVSDGYNDTCHGLDIDGDGMLLKSDLDVPFKTLQVTVLIAGGEVVFFPSTDASRCKEHTSLLMTHDSSIAKARGQMCKPFCEVPGSCWLQERVILDTDKINYVFTCACPRTSCNELFVMFQSDAVPGSISICEVQLLYP